MAPPKFVLGAVVIVFALPRSVRSICKVRTQKHLVGDGFPVPAGMAGTKSVPGAYLFVTSAPPTFPKI